MTSILKQENGELCKHNETTWVNGWYCAKCNTISGKKLPDRPHDNTSLDPKEHAIQKELWKEVWNLCRDYGKHMGFEAVDALMEKYVISCK